MMWAFKTQVPFDSPEVVTDIPTDLSDLQLFRRYCLPMLASDTWKEVPANQIPILL